MEIEGRLLVQRIRIVLPRRGHIFNITMIKADKMINLSTLLNRVFDKSMFCGLPVADGLSDGIYQDLKTN
jgi:hypothetical protein